MANDYLEKLLANWYEYQGYFVFRNQLVGKLAKDSYECKLDVVGLHASKSHLVHTEPSMDCDKWENASSDLRKSSRSGRKWCVTRSM